MTIRNDIRKPWRVCMVLIAIAAGPASANEAATAPPPLPLLSPTALTADAGDGRAYLDWNPQIEDPRVVGWHVEQVAPVERRLTPQPLDAPRYVAHGLANGTAYTFGVVGVLADGVTPRSNLATVTPRETPETRIQPLGTKQLVRIGKFDDVQLAGPAVQVTFPDGQELIYDGFRPIAWRTRDGRDLLYPRHFGNGLDIGRFDERGLGLVIPPGGLVRDFNDIADGRWRIDGGGRFVYEDAQFGTEHPHITDPMTRPQRGARLSGPQWKAPQVDGDRVTFHYWLPIVVWGQRSLTYAMVWETWWPIERDRHGTPYHGLARRVEVEMPGAWKDGYQVMLNNGFGPDGSRDGVRSYSTGFRSPGHEIVDFSGDRNQHVAWQHGRAPRVGYGYHPNHDSLQSSPLIYYEWDGPQPGTLTMTARRLYYHCANRSTSYIEQGHDGVWPSLAWDLGAAGRRIEVDTIEYLYTHDRSRGLPQRFIDARFETFHDVSTRMGVQRELPHGRASLGLNRFAHPLGGLDKVVDRCLELLPGSGATDAGILMDLWVTSPYAVASRYRYDPDYAHNPEIRQQLTRLREAGLSPGYWFRPEFIKTSLVNVMSERFSTAHGWGFDGLVLPPVIERLQQEGFPEVRTHPEWIRRRRDGDAPHRTPYDWTPMRLSGGWWDQIMWPTLWMSRQLGFDWLLLDGGFGGMQGVDYAPLQADRVEEALPMQPFWWRMFRTLHHLDLRLRGECTVGWFGANVTLRGPGTKAFLWMYHAGYTGLHHGDDAPSALHRLYQLYNTTSIHEHRATSIPKRQDYAAVRRFAQTIYTRNGPPRWIEFVNLRPGDPVSVSTKPESTPIAGEPVQDADDSPPQTQTVRPWLWDAVIWHFEDGGSVRYPAYDEIDWQAYGLPDTEPVQPDRR